MENWKYYKNEHIDFFNSERAIAGLINALNDFEEKWLEYIKNEYENYKKDKLNYVDISFIARHVINLIKEKRNEELEVFFKTVEKIYEKCDSETSELMTIGLLESLQNNCYNENIDYHFEFNNWLGKITRKEWNNLIEFWEKDRN